MSETQGFTRDLLVALSGRLGEPSWVLDLRLAAFAQFEATAYPTTDNEEDWRRTDLRGVDFDALATLAQPNGFRGHGLSAEACAGAIRFADGAVVETRLDADLAARGVVWCSLHEAIARWPERVREHFMTRCVQPGEDKFTLLHAAFWNQGLFCWAPAGVTVEQPLLALIELGDQGGSLLHHSLVVAGEGASLSLVEAYAGADAAAALSVPVCEVIAEAGAEVAYASVQSWGAKVVEVATKRALTARDAAVHLCVGNLGGRVVKTFAGAVLAAPGSAVDLLGLAFPGRGQHLDQTTVQDHRAPDCTSNLLFKAAVTDDARSVFRGVINVHPEAQRTDAYQTNNNLLLGEGAEADSMPVLEILADDVKCSHGATLASVDEEDIFYLMSRGLPRAVAQRMVIAGFFEPVLARIPVDSVRGQLQRLVEDRIDQQARGSAGLGD